MMRHWLYDDVDQKLYLLERMVKKWHNTTVNGVKIHEKDFFESMWHTLYGNWRTLENWALKFNGWLHSYHSVDELFKKGKIRVAVRKMSGGRYKEISYEERKELGDEVSKYDFKITTDLETKSDPKNWWP